MTNLRQGSNFKLFYGRLWLIMSRKRPRRLCLSTETLKHFQSNQPTQGWICWFSVFMCSLKTSYEGCLLYHESPIIPNPLATSRAKWTEPSFLRNGLTGQSPVDQLTSGHISPFNDAQHGVGMRSCYSYKNLQGWSLRQEWLSFLKSNQPYMVGYDVLK